MRPLVFANPNAQEHVNFTDWKPVEQTDQPGSAQQPDKDELDREKGRIRFTPRRRKPKPLKKPQQEGNPGFNTELHRDTGRTNFGGDPYMHPQPFDKPSPSTREYYFAPGDHGLSSFLVRSEAETSYQEQTSTDNFVPKSGGLKDIEEDSNFSRKPRTWRFRKNNRDLSLDPGGKGEEEPMDWSVVEQGEHMLPLTSALIFAGPADFMPEEYKYSMPRQQGEGTKSWKSFRTFIYKVGEDTPRYVLDFYIIQPKGKRSFALDPQNMSVAYYNADSPTETEKGIGYRVAVDVVKYLPGAVVNEAIRQTTSDEKPVEGIPKQQVGYEPPKKKGGEAKQPTAEEQELEKLNQANKKAAAELKKKELEQKQRKLQDPLDDELRKIKEEQKRLKLERERRKLQEQKDKEGAARQKSGAKAPGEVGTEEIEVPAQHAGEGKKAEEAVPEDELAVADEIFGVPK